jgi:hypothetical protein
MKTPVLRWRNKIGYSLSLKVSFYLSSNRLLVYEIINVLGGGRGEK